MVVNQSGLNFKRVLDEVRVTGVKMIQNQVGDGDIETKVNICRETVSYTHLDVYKRQQILNIFLRSNNFVYLFFITNMDAHYIRKNTVTDIKYN